MDEVPEVLKTLMQCAHCNNNLSVHDSVTYSECNHVYCGECSQGFCRICSKLGRRQPCKDDPDLVKLLTTLYDARMAIISDDSMFETPFDILLEKLSKDEDYSIPENLLNISKAKGFYPDNSEGNAGGSENVRPGTSKGKGSPNNLNKSMGKNTPKRGVKRRSSISNSDVGPLLKSIKKINAKGENALHEAIKRKDIDLIETLLTHGVHINHTDFAGWTPLHDAVEQNMLSTVKLLLQKGAVVNATGFENKTPLHLAVGNPEMINLLLSFGADPLAKDLYGHTPKDLSKNEMIVPDTLKKENVPKGFSKQIIHVPKAEDSRKITQFLKKFNLELSGRNTENVTCVIIPKNINLSEFDWELVQVLARGALLVTSQWCDESLAAGVLKNLDDFEVQPDWMPGLLSARRNSLMLRPGLFSGISFYFAPGRIRSVRYQGQLIDLSELKRVIQLCGGKLLGRNPDEEAREDSPVPFHAGPGPLEKCYNIILDVTSDYSIKPRFRMPHIKVLTVPWILDCLLNFKLIDEELDSYFFC